MLPQHVFRRGTPLPTCSTAYDMALFVCVYKYFIILTSACPQLLTICLRLDFSLTLLLSIVFSSTLPSTGGVDFVSDIFPIDVVFPANTTILEASFTLIDDNVIECDEAFGFALVYNGCQPGVSLRPGSSSGNLTIVDDDGKKTVIYKYLHRDMICPMTSAPLECVRLTRCWIN